MWRADGFVERRADDFAVRAFDLPLHVGDFFRPLVDQQHDDVGFGIVRQHALAIFCSRIVLPARGGLTIRPRWPKPIGTIMSTTRMSTSSAVVSSTMRLSGCSGVRSSKKTFSRQQVRVVVVDRLDAQQREVALVFLRRADLPGHRRAGAQAEAANLAGRDVDVVRAGEVVVVGAAEEAEAVGQDFQRAFAEHQAVELHPLFEDPEDQILLLDAGDLRTVLLAGLLDELRHAHPLQLGDVDVALLDLLVAIVGFVVAADRSIVAIRLFRQLFGQRKRLFLVSQIFRITRITIVTVGISISSIVPLLRVTESLLVVAKARLVNWSLVIELLTGMLHAQELRVWWDLWTLSEMWNEDEERM